MSAPANELGPLLDALDGDGVIVAPCPVGYLAAASSAAGVDRIFELKGRDRSRSLSVGGHALHEGRRYLQELAGLGDLELSELSATMGLIGTRRDDAPPTPEGVGTAESLAVFVGLGPLLDELIVRQRAAGRTLYVTSANASGPYSVRHCCSVPPPLARVCLAFLRFLRDATQSVGALAACTALFFLPISVLVVPHATLP